jgi:hypothetical protein
MQDGVDWTQDSEAGTNRWPPEIDLKYDLRTMLCQIAGADAKE